MRFVSSSIRLAVRLILLCSLLLSEFDSVEAQVERFARENQGAAVRFAVDNLDMFIVRAEVHSFLACL